MTIIINVLQNLQIITGNYQTYNYKNVGLAVKTLLYFCKGENTSSISRKRTY